MLSLRKIVILLQEPIIMILKVTVHLFAPCLGVFVSLRVMYVLRTTREASQSLKISPNIKKQF